VLREEIVRSSPGAFSVRIQRMSGDVPRNFPPVDPAEEEDEAIAGQDPEDASDGCEPEVRLLPADREARSRGA
jgi:hypothetical protein